MKKTKSAKSGAKPSSAVAAGNGAANENEPVKVKNQAELDAALKSGAKIIEIHGKWKEVVIPAEAKLRRVYVSGTVEGSVYVSGIDAIEGVKS